MSGLIELMAVIFVFIIELIFDIISFAVWIASWAAFWRLPWSLRLYEVNKRSAYREFCWGCFLAFIFDYFTIVPLVILIPSWRLPVLIAYLRDVHDNTGWKEVHWNYHRRLVIWLQFGRWILDIPCIIMVVIIHAIFWHIPHFYAEICAEIRSKGAAIFLLKWNDNEPDTEHRKIIAIVCVDALLDIFCLPALAIIAVSVYRISVVKKEFSLIDSESTPNNSSQIASSLFQKKGVLFVQAAWVLIDLPFFIIGILAFVIPLGFRGKALLEDLDLCDRVATTAGDRRMAVLIHFVFGFRDLLCFPPFIVVLCSFYRGFLAVKKLIDAVSRWASSPPAITALSVVPVLPERGNGLIFRVKASKPAGFTLPRDATVKLFIRNTSFWDGVAHTFGAAAGSIGQAMLPMSISPQYFDPSKINPCATDCEFDIDFNTSYSTSTIIKNCKKFGTSVYADAHIEFGDHEGTLLFLRVSVSELEDYAKANRSIEAKDRIPSEYSAEQMRGQRLCDVFWKIVLMQMLWLIIDIAAIVSFFLLHLFPHRVLRLYGSGCEGTARRKARKIVKILEAAQRIVRRKTQVLEDAIVAVDDSARTSSDEHWRNDWRWRRRYGRGYRRFDYFFPRWHSFSEKNNTEIVLTAPTDYQDYVKDAEKCVSQLTEQGATEGATVVQKCLDHLLSVLCSYESILVGKFGCDAQDLFAWIRNRSSVLNLKAGREDTAYSLAEMRTETVFSATEPVSIEEAESRDLQRALMLSLQAQQQQQKPSDDPDPAPVAASQAAMEMADGNISHTLHELLLQSKESDIEIAHAMTNAIKNADKVFSETNWCGGKDGWEGFRSAIFREIAQLMFDFAAVVCFTLTFCTVYRTYSLIYAVTHSDNWRKAAVFSFAEIFIDMWYLFKFALVMIGIKGIVSLPSDLVFFWIRKPSFFVARQVIDHHLLLLGSDVLYLLSLMFAWDAIRVFFATLVFGAFAPGVMLESAFSVWEWDPGDQRHHVVGQGLCCSVMLLVIALFWFVGIPLIVGLSIIKASSVAAKAVFWGANGLLILLGVIVAVRRQEEQLTKTRRSIVRYLRPTWHNVSAYFAVVLEWVQLYGLLFSASTVKMYGSEISVALEKASRYVFLLFGENWAAQGIPFGVYFALACAILSFIVAAAPIVMGDMLKWRKGHELLRSSLWIAAMQFLGQFCLLLLVRNLSLMLMCDGVGEPMLFAPNSVCWEGRHLGLTITCMIFFSYSVPNSLMRNIKYNESICQTLDVVYPQLYKLLVNVPFAAAACITLIYVTSPVGVSFTILFASLWALGVTLLYGRVLNPDEGVACSVLSMHTWRSAEYGSVALGSIFQMIAAFSEPEGPWPLYAMIACTVLCLLVLTVRSVQLHNQRIPLDDSIEELQGILLRTEASAMRAYAMQDSWKRQEESDWQSSVRAATRVSQLAWLALRFERKIHINALPKLFLQLREKWSNEMRSLVSVCDLDQLLNVEHEIPDGNIIALIICCDWGCDSHLRGGRDDDGGVGISDTEKMPKLQEGIFALQNAMLSGL